MTTTWQVFGASEGEERRVKGWALPKRERNYLNKVLPTLDSLQIYISKDDRFLEVFILELIFCFSILPLLYPVSCTARILLAAMKQGCGKWPSVIKNLFFILKQSIDIRIL